MKKSIPILILLALSACSKQPTEMAELSNPVVEAKVEARLAQWQPDHADLRATLGNMLSTNAAPLGDWKNSDISMEENRMTIRRKRGGQYEVLFSTHGCVDFWTLTRQATYSKGVFQMDRPIEEYSGAQYDTLYTIVVSNLTVLVPQSEARNVQSNDQRALFLGFTKNRWREHNNQIEHTR